MRLWKMEFSKIAARPVMNVGFLILTGFFMLIIWQEAKGSRTEIDGIVYQGIEAVKKDRELAKEYEGIFTMEKAEDIVERFGFSGYVGENSVEFSRVREGNYCSQFVTDKMTDFMQTERKPSNFLEGEAWENYGRYFVSGSVQFGYAAGWRKLTEIWTMAVLSLNFWLVLMTAPVFSEEYSRNTTGILLSTQRGKSEDIRKKITAALGLGLMAYALLTVLLAGSTVAAYGSDGLHASAQMACDSLWGDMWKNRSVSFFLLWMFLAGMVSVLLNTAVILLVSAKAKRPVTAVTTGLILFLLPWGVNQFLFQIMMSVGIANSFAGWIFMDGIRIFCFSMPFYLTFSDIFSIPENWLVFLPIVALSVMALSIWRAQANYRNYQEG